MCCCGQHALKDKRKWVVQCPDLMSANQSIITSSNAEMMPVDKAVKIKTNCKDICSKSLDRKPNRPVLCEIEATLLASFRSNIRLIHRRSKERRNLKIRLNLQDRQRLLFFAVLLGVDTVMAVVSKVEPRDSSQFELREG